MVTVSTEVKALVEKTAKEVCDIAKVKYQAFNQDLNAYTALRVYKAIDGMDNVDDAGKVKLRLQAAKKLGNASALRQAITGETTKNAVADSIVSELLPED